MSVKNSQPTASLGCWCWAIAAFTGPGGQTCRALSRSQPQPVSGTQGDQSCWNLLWARPFQVISFPRVLTARGGGGLEQQLLSIFCALSCCTASSPGQTLLSQYLTGGGGSRTDISSLSEGQHAMRKKKKKLKYNLIVQGDFLEHSWLFIAPSFKFPRRSRRQRFFHDSFEEQTHTYLNKSHHGSCF